MTANRIDPAHPNTHDVSIFPDACCLQTLELKDQQITLEKKAAKSSAKQDIQSNLYVRRNKVSSEHFAGTIESMNR